jgi:hypothetical protein
MTPRTYQTSTYAERIRSYLTPLDRLLVERLATVTYASTQQLQELALPLEQDPARARRIRRRLAHLADLKVVYQHQRSVGGLGGGSRGSVWTLERTGYALSGQPTPHNDLRPARERGLAFLNHALAVTQHGVDLERYTRQRGLRVASWVAEPASRIPYHDSSTGRLAYLTPDAQCEVHTPDERLVSALEVDRGTEGRTTLERKAGRYIAYAARRPEAPQVVWSFTTAPRAAMFTDAVNRSFRQPAIATLLDRGLFVITTSDHAAAALCGEAPG